MNPQEIDMKKLRKVVLSSKKQSVEKSMIDDFSYNKDNLVITKTGKAFKELLGKVKTSLKEQCDEKQAKMTIYLSMIKSNGYTADPTEEPSSYAYGGLRKSAFPYIPKMFSYEQRYGKDDGMSKEESEYPVEAAPMGGDYGSSDLTKMSIPTTNTTKKVKDYMQDYNDCARTYISRVADKLFIDGIVSSLGDKASVKLSGTMLKLLV